MTLWWVIVFLMVSWFLYSTDVSKKAFSSNSSATTRITVIDQANDKVAIELSFDGKQSDLAELERRVKEAIKKKP